MLEQLLHIDGQILLWIQEYLRFPALTSVMKDITNLGNAGILWILITIVLLLDKKTRNVGYMSALALIGSLIVDNILLKNLVARTRPYEVVDGLKLLIEKQSDYSFPSGHTGSSFASAIVLWKELPRKYGVMALIVAVLIGIFTVICRGALSVRCVGRSGDWNRTGVSFGMAGKKDSGAEETCEVRETFLN